MIGAHTTFGLTKFGTAQPRTWTDARGAWTENSSSISFESTQESWSIIDGIIDIRTKNRTYSEVAGVISYEGPEGKWSDVGGIKDFSDGNTTLTEVGGVKSGNIDGESFDQVGDIKSQNDTLINGAPTDVTEDPVDDSYSDVE